MSVEFTETEWAFYDLEAETLDAAADAVSQRDEAATTEWFPRYEYEADEVLTSASVSVITKVTLPRWIGAQNATTAERAEWARFCKALRAHEDGHLRLVTTHLADMDSRLIGRSIEGAAKAWKDALDALAAASRDYDRETDHGRKLGTILDLSAAHAEL
jgi:predicted secreted Zn-dependent protease